MWPKHLRDHIIAQIATVDRKGCHHSFVLYIATGSEDRHTTYIAYPLGDEWMQGVGERLVCNTLKGKSFGTSRMTNASRWNHPSTRDVRRSHQTIIA